MRQFILHLSYHGRSIGAFHCYTTGAAAAHIKYAAMRKGVSALVIDYRIERI